MKYFLLISAIVEMLTGLSLLLIPAMTVSILLGVGLTESSGIVVARFGGAALTSLAAACWMSQKESKSSAIMVKTMALYNFLAALLLLYARSAEHLPGVGLWPAILLHFGMEVWALALLRENRLNPER